jgi:hypothetical protein
MAQGCLYKALIFLGNALFEWYLIHKERINLLVRYGLYKRKCHARDMGRSNRSTSRPSYGKANAPASQCGGEHAVL